MKNTNVYTVLTGTLACVLLVSITPVVANAQTIGYEPRTIQEQIAFLFGVISQLQEQLNALEGRRDDRIPSAPGSDDDVRLDVETRTATDIEDDEAELRGEVDLRGASYARVWFEYGEDGDLDEDTTRRRVSDRVGNERRFSAVIDDLDEDERYYFRAVAENPAGRRYYGTTRSFRTDEDGFNDDDDRDGDFELTVLESTIDAGDTIEVEYELDDDRSWGRGWVGLYDTDENDDQDYLDWEWTESDDDRGELEFEIDDEGEYVFRLFRGSGYDELAESREFEVE